MRPAPRSFAAHPSFLSFSSVAKNLKKEGCLLKDDRGGYGVLMILPDRCSFFQKCDRVSGNWIYAATNGKTRPITVTTISGILNLKPLL